MRCDCKPLLNCRAELFHTDLQARRLQLAAYKTRTSTVHWECRQCSLTFYVGYWHTQHTIQARCMLWILSEVITTKSEQRETTHHRDVLNALDDSKSSLNKTPCSCSAFSRCRPSDSTHKHSLPLNSHWIQAAQLSLTNYTWYLRKRRAVSL